MDIKVVEGWAHLPDVAWVFRFLIASFFSLSFAGQAVGIWLGPQPPGGEAYWNQTGDVSINITTSNTLPTRSKRAIAFLSALPAVTRAQQNTYAMQVALWPIRCGTKKET